MIGAETGENYAVELLHGLPLHPVFGCFLLVTGQQDDSFTQFTDMPKSLDSEQIHGLFFAMQIDAQTSRVLSFVVDAKQQRRGYGSRCWNLFTSSACASGLQWVQLEVRSDNQDAIRFYERRGLSTSGKMKGFYHGDDGMLMSGPLKLPTIEVNRNQQ
jgi:ribosomal protein S18 acetylase RimI-like enzyme